MDKIRRIFVASRRGALATALLTATSAAAARFPNQKEGDWIARDFKFHTSEAMHELRVHYTPRGAPTGEATLVLHGTAG